MAETIRLTVNGKPVDVPAGATVAAAIVASGEPARRSVGGEPRTALCGMGICYECRARVNGVWHVRTCRIVCEPGMEVATDA